MEYTFLIFLILLKGRGLTQMQCGKQLEGLQGEVTHPEYPEKYGSDADCRWTTIAREKDDVKLSFELLDMESDREGRCSYDYVSIKFSSKDGPEKFCGIEGQRTADAKMQTEGKGPLVIRFITDDSMEFKGFKLRYEITRYDYCLDEPCKNEGRCILEEQDSEGWVCACIRGWEGKTCETDKDECAPEPCQNGGSCTTPEFDMYKCDCVPGYTGDNCETDINECESSPCQNGGECTDEANSYECICANGYVGTNCETDIDECASNPCKNGGRCIDQVARFACRCVAGYEGDDCSINRDDCASDPCQNDGDCIDGIDKYSCDCEDGFVGDHCQIDIPECSSSPCKNGARCFEPKPDEYFCACAPGYTGRNCDIEYDECSSSPCLNNATCVDKSNGYDCQCAIGFEGETCEIEINECDSDPCQNGGTCHDKIGSFECECKEGFYGTLCESETNHCESNPCLNGATCNSTKTEYTCHCLEGFEGEHCETDVDECSSGPCTNGGTCKDGINRFDCECTPGYGGVMCEIELDECDSDPCKNDGNCIDYPSKFECICKKGYAGETCEIDQTSPCLSNPCQNGGTCEEDNSKGFRCICTEKYDGDLCDKEKENDNKTDAEWKDDKECHPYSCLNNGVCDQHDGYFTCSCNPGFTGKYCETDINECESEPCQNGGSCMDRANEYWCICRDGFKGLQCQDDSEADWQKDSHLLAALLPSILFLIVIGILAALFMLWVRKRRSAANKVNNINVKPKKNKKSDPKKDRSFKITERSSKKQKKDKTNIIDYDPVEPYAETFQMQNLTNEYQYPTKYKAQSDPLMTGVPEGHLNPSQYSSVPGVGMVYPTNHPQLPYGIQNRYPQYPQTNQAHHYEDFQNYNSYNPNQYDEDTPSSYNYYEEPKVNHEPEPYRDKERRESINRHDKGREYKTPYKSNQHSRKSHKHKQPKHKPESVESASDSQDTISEIDLEDYTEYNSRKDDDQLLSLNSDLSSLHGQSTSPPKEKTSKIMGPPLVRDEYIDGLIKERVIGQNPVTKDKAVRFDLPADHWQDRDTELLKNVPEEHQRNYINPNMGRNHGGKYGYLPHNTDKPRKQVQRKRSVTFCEPKDLSKNNRNKEKPRERKGKPHPSIEREKTGFFPNKSKLHRRNSDDDRKRPEKRRQPVRRSQSIDSGKGTPVKDNKSHHRSKDNYDRRPPEGDSSAMSGESDDLRKSFQQTPSSYNSSPFKLIRRNNSLKVNEGRGFRREAAFFQN
uniref:fibropellin-1-like n=1 Tax=Styela clava TaxID=7725 RepID=UPI001939CF85|nr:fibropellin-1-like [Styela clava]